MVGHFALVAQLDCEKVVVRPASSFATILVEPKVIRCWAQQRNLVDRNRLPGEMATTLRFYQMVPFSSHPTGRVHMPSRDKSNEHEPSSTSASYVKRPPIFSLRLARLAQWWSPEWIRPTQVQTVCCPHKCASQHICPKFGKGHHLECSQERNLPEIHGAKCLQRSCWI